MKLVLDANALWHRPLMQALTEACAAGFMERGRIEAILPAVAYAERLRQLRRDGRNEEVWRSTLAGAGVRIEPFGEDEARRLASRATVEESWRRHARDYLVAAHVHGAREVVTSDDGPVWSEVPRVTPAEVAQAVATLLAG